MPVQDDRKRSWTWGDLDDKLGRRTVQYNETSYNHVTTSYSKGPNVPQVKFSIIGSRSKES